MYAKDVLCDAKGKEDFIQTLSGFYTRFIGVCYTIFYTSHTEAFRLKSTTRNWRARLLGRLRGLASSGGALLAEVSLPKMKKTLVVAALSVFLLPSLTMAAGINYQQASSIIVLLEAFGVNQDTVNTVWALIQPGDTPITPPTVATTQDGRPSQANAALAASSPSVCGTNADTPVLSLTPESTSTEMIGNGKYYYFDILTSGPCVSSDEANWTLTTPNPADNVALHLIPDSLNGYGRWAIGYMPVNPGDQMITVTVDGSSASVIATAGISEQEQEIEDVKSQINQEEALISQANTACDTAPDLTFQQGSAAIIQYNEIQSCGNISEELSYEEQYLSQLQAKLQSLTS